MRTVTYGAACSLDGFITARDGAMDWLHFSPDVQEIMTAYWATIDTVVMGRKSWEVAAGQFSEGGGGAGVTTYVCSRTLASVPAGIELVSSDAGEFVRRLKRRPGKGICVLGGGELARALFEVGVIDEVGLNVHPILLGSGVPFFRDVGRRITLDLLELRAIAGGCVLLRYRVRKSSPATARETPGGRARSRRR